MKHLLKLLYAIIPFKKAIFKIFKIFLFVPQSVYKHLHFKGQFKVNVDKSTSFEMMHHGFYIENEIFWRGLFGNWEKDSLLIWSKLCKESNVILDIGANTGVYALLAKSINANNCVFAFDPVQRVYDKLVENVRINEFKINTYQCALSNKTGDAIIFDDEEEHTYSVTVNKNLNLTEKEVKEVQVKTMRLDEFIVKNNIDIIDLMKIDVETHEPEVLEGMGEYLQRFKPSILIEVLNDEIAKKIEDLINGLDYLKFNIDEKGRFEKVDKLKKSGYRNIILCVPSMAAKLGLIS